MTLVIDTVTGICQGTFSSLEDAKEAAKMISVWLKTTETYSVRVYDKDGSLVAELDDEIKHERRSTNDH